MSSQQEKVSQVIETVIVPRERDLGDGFVVRRALPAAGRRMVGPFVFFDQMGPVELGPGNGLDVRPHPHIGLATVTYLFQGALLHRDSLGSVQRIEPGAVNWMTAGRGIVHSERSPDPERSQGHRLSGIQIWVALPKAHEEIDPSFAHFPAKVLPTSETAGLTIRLIAGTLFGLRSPVPTLSKLFYADVTLSAGTPLRLSDEHVQRAAYVVEGRIEIGSSSFGPGGMPVFRPGGDIVMTARASSRLLVLGGEPLDGPRHVVWNFVSSSARRVAQAKEDWKHGRFPTVPGETDFIPLPEGLPSPAD